MVAEGFSQMIGWAYALLSLAVFLGGVGLFILAFRSLMSWDG